MEKLGEGGEKRERWGKGSVRSSVIMDACMGWARRYGREKRGKVEEVSIDRNEHKKLSWPFGFMVVGEGYARRRRIK
jgi:hypothetical protein